jgi:hypothetical protein
MHTKEFQRILAKMPPEEQAVIFWWRVWFFPRVLTAEEIAAHVKLPSDHVHQIIIKFNRHCRLKIELACFLSTLYKDIIPDLKQLDR